MDSSGAAENDPSRGNDESKEQDFGIYSADEEGARLDIDDERRGDTRLNLNA